MALLPTVLATVLLLLPVICAADTHFHTLPSGRRVPLSAIRSHPFADRTGNDGHQLFELSEHGVLTGGVSANNIKLHEHTHTQKLKYHPKLSLSLNGRILDKHLPGATTRMGHGFTAVYADGDDKPVAITLGVADLAPLHFADHPGVYIASASHAVVETRDPAVEVGVDNEMPESSSRLPTGERTLREVGEVEEAPGSRINDTPATIGMEKTSLEATHLRQTLRIPKPRLTPTARQVRFCGAQAAKRFYDLAIAFDNTLCARYDNKYERVVAAIQANTNAGNAAFSTDLCVRMAVVHIEANCQNENDDYARTKDARTEDVLLNFQKVWKNDRGWVERDLAVLHTGYVGAQAGSNIAFRTSSCSKERGYALSERLSRAGIASAVAFTIGGELANGGLLQATPPEGVIRLGPQSVQLVRKYLETDKRSECITQKRQVCPANCLGRCIAGACVTGNKVVMRCKETFTAKQPVACAEPSSARFLTPWLDLLKVTTSIQFGRLVTKVEVEAGVVVMQIGYAVGSQPDVIGGAAQTTRKGNTVTYRTVIGDLPGPAAGTTCCGFMVNVVLRIGGCLVGRCGVVRNTYVVDLKCNDICSGRGTPLPMTESRRCPTCRV